MQFADLDILSTAQCGCGHCAFQDIIHHRCQVPRNGIRFPFIDTKEMSNAERASLTSLLTDEAKIIFEQFDILFGKYSTWIEKNNVTLKLYKSVLQNITGAEALSENNICLLEDRKKEIREANDFELLADIIHQYVNWFNYSLLGKIIGRISCEIAKNSDDFSKEVEKYELELQQFCKRNIYECPMSSELPHDPYQKYLCVKVEMPDNHMKFLKAKHIMKFQADLGKALDLPLYTLKLCSVAEGCVEILFSIPTSIHNAIIPLHDGVLNKLIPLGVIKICTDRYVIEWNKISQCFDLMLDKVYCIFIHKCMYYIHTTSMPDFVT